MNKHVSHKSPNFITSPRIVNEERVHWDLSTVETHRLAFSCKFKCMVDKNCNLKINDLEKISKL
jgi:hypothetical protein